MLSAQLIRAAAAQRRTASLEIEPGFRQVGTFGGLHGFDREAMPLPSTGSAGKAVLARLALFAFGAAGTMIKFAWDEAHPDIRSAYSQVE